MNVCPQFWAENPAILLKGAHDFFPFHAEARRCTTTALNSFTRFGLYLGIILSFLSRNVNYLLLSVGIALIAVAAFYGMKRNGSIREGMEEGFAAASSISVAPPAPVPRPVMFTMPGVVPPEPEKLIKGIEAAGKPVEDIIGQTKRTDPTGANPFMNVLLTEIGDNPTRPPAANGEFLKRQFSDEFQQRIYGDPGDVFQHTQNQRVWTVNPATSIPNDRDSFQNWLYRVPGRTCKEGNTRICKTGTEGGQVTWISQA
jgi:hypothetical protein